MKTIEINGARYSEAPFKEPVAKTEDGAICAQCVFFNDRYGCRDAIENSAAVFGGDCIKNDVVYAKVPA